VAICLQTVNLDCSDPQEMARFYGGLLGWEPTAVEPDWVLMRDPKGGTGLSFQQIEGYQSPTWPEEPGQQQKMIHLDIRVTPATADALEEAARLALSVGGTLAESQPREDLRIILDPSGHPLCLFLY